MAQVLIPLHTCLQCDGRRVDQGDTVDLNLNPDVFDEATISSYSPLRGVVLEVAIPDGGTTTTAELLITVEVENADLPPGVVTLTPDDLSSVTCIGCCHQNADNIADHETRIAALEDVVVVSFGGNKEFDYEKLLQFGSEGDITGSWRIRAVDRTFHTIHHIEMVSDNTDEQRLTAKQNTYTLNLNFPQASSDLDWSLPLASGNLALVAATDGTIVSADISDASSGGNGASDAAKVAAYGTGGRLSCSFGFYLHNSGGGSHAFYPSSNAGHFTLTPPLASGTLALTSQSDGSIDLSDVTIEKTNDASAGTSATINKPSGSVVLSSANSSFVLTNSLITADSIVLATVATSDATLKSVVAVPDAGEVEFIGNAACTADTKINFLVIN